ncbi:MAG: 6-phosphogluconolactonase [Mucilaginibacter polytrichastri]|nr:6-phosphogluconolactonase [Mucilaginibacter polytrichastri]
MDYHIHDTPDEVIRDLAEFFVADAKAALQTKDRYSVSLSGGSSPKKLYELLAADYRDHLQWDKLYFFFGDERNVPHTSSDSNFLMAKTALFEPLEIHPLHVFAVDTQLEPEAAAADYARTITHYFKNGPVQFDFMLLGLGDNSHTASLFPHTPILDDQESSVKAVWLEDQQVYRISMTAPMINDSRQTAFLLYGKGKAEAVREVIKGEPNVPQHPAQLIKPVNGQLHWFMDKEAASDL